MPPVNDSNNIPGSAGGPLVNGNSAGNSSNDNVKKFTFPSHQFHMVHLAKMCQENKGQLISKCPYEKSVSSKIPTKIFLEFCPEIFCSFLGASWKLFGLPGDLVSNIINKEGYWKPKKLPGSPQKATKNFRAEIQKYFHRYFG